MSSGEKEYGPSPRWKDAESGRDTLNKYRDDWSKLLAEKSLQASYAIIAATWAIHGDKIVDNGFAVIAISLAVGQIGIYIFMVWIVYTLLDRRADEARYKPEEWDAEYGTSDNPASYWPFTKGIEKVGELHNDLKMLLPILAAGFWLYSVWVKFNQAIVVSVP